MEIAIVIAVIAAIFIARSVKFVPQQHGWVLSRVMQTWLGTSSGISLRLCL